MFNTKAKVKSIGLSVLGGLAILAINVLATKAAAPKVSQYVIATTQVPPGINLSAKDLALQSVKGEIPDGSFTNINALKDKQLSVSAVKGEPITQNMVSSKPTRQNLPNGYAAYWVATGIGTTGFPSVGDVVSIYDAKGTEIIPGGYRVIGAVDNQGKTIQSGDAAAVEIAVPQLSISNLILNAAGIHLVLDPWTSLEQQGVITNDQTNMVYSGGSHNSPPVSGASGVPSQSGAKPGTGTSH